MHLAALIVSVGLLPLTGASYVLQDRYYNLNFWSKFSFFTGPDPGNGYVNYTDQTTAQRNGIINAGDNGNLYIGVDNTDPATGRGRSSVLLQSLKTYTHGLFVLDIAHMPGGICSVWPTISLAGAGGSQLNIISGINTASQNLLSLHTTSACTINQGTSFSNSSLLSANCTDTSTTSITNGGCVFQAHSPNSYGTGFNGHNGGFYAVEWTTQGISIWFWPRGSSPANLASGSPNPASWGLPVAAFGNGCRVDDHMTNARIVIGIDFCGWAGTQWAAGGCANALGGDCVKYVRDRPGDFFGAYWTINSIGVYQKR